MRTGHYAPDGARLENNTIIVIGNIRWILNANMYSTWHLGMWIYERVCAVDNHQPTYEKGVVCLACSRSSNVWFDSLWSECSNERKMLNGNPTFVEITWALVADMTLSFQLDGPMNSEHILFTMHRDPDKRRFEQTRATAVKTKKKKKTLVPTK